MSIKYESSLAQNILIGVFVRNWILKKFWKSIAKPEFFNERVLFKYLKWVQKVAMQCCWAFIKESEISK